MDWYQSSQCPTTRVQKNNSCRKDNLLLQWLGRFPSRAKKIDVVSRYFDSYWDAANAVMHLNHHCSLNAMNCPQDSFPNNICLVQPCLLGLLLEQGGLILGLLEHPRGHQTFQAAKSSKTSLPHHVFKSQKPSFYAMQDKGATPLPKKNDFSVTKDLWSFYPGIKACECLPRAYFILTDKWKMYSRPISIVTTDWRVNKLMNTTLNLWCIVLHVLHAHRVLKNWDHHIIGNCTMAQGNLH